MAPPMDTAVPYKEWMVFSTYILSYIEFMLTICAPIAPGASICPTFIAVPPVEVIWPTFIALPSLLKNADILLAMDTQSPVILLESVPH